MRKSATLLSAALAVLALGACGDSHTRVTTGTYAGESGKNAPYLNVGPLVYEVQISRELNPYNNEDAGYLQGVPLAARRLGPGEEWFGVFLQVVNHGDLPRTASPAITIRDTQGNTYTPIVPAISNTYAYRGGTVPGKGIIPHPDTTGAFGPTQGAVVLYKIKIASLDNRPLQLRIGNPLRASQFASAELDV
jgi:hypothetical protein